VVIVGIDDTDVIDSPGTNQLARAILKGIVPASRDAIITRHQLFFDPRVPYTSKNGSASIQLPSAAAGDVTELGNSIRKIMADWFVEGSDPGLCIATEVNGAMEEFGLRCKGRVITQEEAREVAAGSGCYLRGLGGTNQGIVGALAAVGLIASGDDGRIVHLDSWPYPDDDFAGPRTIEAIRARGIDEVRNLESGKLLREGMVEVVKRLRPNWQNGRIVLFVDKVTEAGYTAPWRTVKIP